MRYYPGTRQKPIKHGSKTGYRLHLQRSEEPCSVCRDAHNRNTLQNRRNQVNVPIEVLEWFLENPDDEHARNILSQKVKRRKEYNENFPVQ